MVVFELLEIFTKWISRSEKYKRLFRKPNKMITITADLFVATEARYKRLSNLDLKGAQRREQPRKTRTKRESPASRNEKILKSNFERGSEGQKIVRAWRR